MCSEIYVYISLILEKIYILPTIKSKSAFFVTLQIVFRSFGLNLIIFFSALFSIETFY